MPDVRVQQNTEDALAAPVQDYLSDPLQFDGSVDTGGLGDLHSLARDGLSGGGGRLPYFDSIQESFGRHDVSGVTAHTGSKAKEANRSIGSEAYASGDQVALGSQDLFTTAHEAAHVIQQQNGVSLRDGVGDDGDPYEQHADEVAEAVVHGESAEPILDQMAGTGGSGKGVQFRWWSKGSKSEDTGAVTGFLGMDLSEDANEALGNWGAVPGVSGVAGALSGSKGGWDKTDEGVSGLSSKVFGKKGERNWFGKLFGKDKSDKRGAVGSTLMAPVDGIAGGASQVDEGLKGIRDKITPDVDPNGGVGRFFGLDKQNQMDEALGDGAGGTAGKAALHLTGAYALGSTVAGGYGGAKMAGQGLYESEAFKKTSKAATGGANAAWKILKTSWAGNDEEGSALDQMAAKTIVKDWSTWNEAKAQKWLSSKKGDSKAWNGFINVLKVGTGLGQILTKSCKTILRALYAIGGSILSLLVGAIGWGIPRLVQFLGLAIAGAVGGAVGAVGGAITGAAKTVGHAVGTAARVAGGVIGGAGALAGEALRGGAKVVGGALGAVGGFLYGGITGFGGVLKKGWGNLTKSRHEKNEAARAKSMEKDQTAAATLTTDASGTTKARKLVADQVRRLDDDKWKIQKYWAYLSTIDPVQERTETNQKLGHARDQLKTGQYDAMGGKKWAKADLAKYTKKSKFFDMMIKKMPVFHMASTLTGAKADGAYDLYKQLEAAENNGQALTPDQQAQVSTVVADRAQVHTWKAGMQKIKGDYADFEPIMKKGARYAKKGAGIAANTILSMATGGLVGRSEEDVNGGRESKGKLTLFPFVGEARTLIKRLKAVKQSGAMGGQTASNIYMVLKFLSKFIIPFVRRLFGTVGLWAAGLALLTMGGTAPVAAFCGAAALSLTIFKAVLDTGLAIWSGICSARAKDPRAKSAAKAEAIDSGIDAAVNTAAALAGGLYAQSATGGDSVSAGDAFVGKMSGSTAIESGLAGGAIKAGTGIGSEALATGTKKLGVAMDHRGLREQAAFEDRVGRVRGPSSLGGLGEEEQILDPKHQIQFAGGGLRSWWGGRKKKAPSELIAPDPVSTAERQEEAARKKKKDLASKGRGVESKLDGLGGRLTSAGKKADKHQSAEAGENGGNESQGKAMKEIASVFKGALSDDR